MLFTLNFFTRLTTFVVSLCSCLSFALFILFVCLSFALFISFASHNYKFLSIDSLSSFQSSQCLSFNGFCFLALLVEGTYCSIGSSSLLPHRFRCRRCCSCYPTTLHRQLWFTHKVGVCCFKF